MVGSWHKNYMLVHISRSYHKNYTLVNKHNYIDKVKARLWRNHSSYSYQYLSPRSQALQGSFALLLTTKKSKS
jgi:hypothetical protein